MSNTHSKSNWFIVLTICLLTFFTIVIAQTNGLVAHYPFNGDVNDESGNGNDGIVNGATLTTDRFGNANSAYSFDGVDDNITITDNGDLSLTTFTVAAWMKHDFPELGVSKTFLLKGRAGIDSPGENANYWLSLDENYEVVVVFEEGDGTDHIVESLPISNDWHFIVGSFSGTQLSLYIDGYSVDICTTSATPETNTYPLVFGQNPYWGGDIYKGVLDDLRIYNRDLSAVEIDSLYHLGGWDQSLVAYYPFNGDVDDESGNGNDGTLLPSYPDNCPQQASDRFGNPNSAYYFDGVDDIINFQDSTNLDGFSVATISLWMNPGIDMNSSTGRQDIVYKGEPAQYTLNYDSHDGMLTATFNNAYHSIDYATEFNSGQWYHICLVYDGTPTLIMYVDGISVGVGNNQASPLNPDNSQPLTIGATDEPLYHFNGTIDDIRIYNHALTESGIATLYHEGGWDPSLVAYYPFNSNANDGSGNGNDGTINGATLTTDRFGNQNSAYSFDGIDDYIDVPYENELRLSAPFTVSAWVKLADNFSTRGYVLAKSSSLDGHVNYAVRIYDDFRLSFRYYQDWTTPIEIFCDTLLETTEWYHILAKHDSNNVYLYLDGDLMVSQQVTNPYVLTTTAQEEQNLGIGRHTYGGSQPDYFNGVIDEVQIYNRALSNTEIDSLYHTGGWDQYAEHTTFSDDFTFFDTTKWIKHDAGSNNVNVDDEAADMVYIDAARNWEPACRITHEMHIGNNDFYTQFDIKWTGGDQGGFNVGWSTTNEYYYVQSHDDYSTLVKWQNFMALQFGSNLTYLVSDVDGVSVPGTGLFVDTMIQGTPYTAVIQRVDSLITGQLWTIGKDSLIEELTATVPRIEDYQYFHISSWDNMMNSVHQYYELDNLFISVGRDTVEPILISIDENDANVNDTVLVPINVEFPIDSLYRAAELNFDGYQTGLNFIGIDTTGSMIGGTDWIYSINETDTLMFTAYAGTDNISGSGVFCYLKFVATGAICSTVPIECVYAKFNSTETDDITNGEVYIKPIPVYGDVDENTFVEALDASEVLQHVINIDTLDCQGFANADVTNDGTISALDASVILQYVVHLIDSLPYTEPLLAEGSMSFTDGVILPGATVELPLLLSNGSNILSFEGELVYNPDHLSFASIEWSSLLSGFTINTRTEEGIIDFAGASANPDGQEGVFATVHFTVNSSFSEDETQVILNKMRLNEGLITSDVVTATLVLGIGDEKAEIPNQFALHQNYPNPFNPTTQLRYDLPEQAFVKLAIYDLLGRQVTTLVSRVEEPGYRSVTWNGTDTMGKAVSAGMYLYVIKAGDYMQTKKMILLK